MSENTATPKYSKKDWETVRLNFSSSLMVDTRLNSLAQNVELRDWPLKGENETPSKYIDYNWEELLEIPGIADYPDRIDLLIDILKETMAFDDPFGEMVDSVEIATEREDTLEKTLKELEIQQDCPLKYSALSPDTLDFCQAEGIETVGEFAVFSQNMAQNIVVGGDFKALLNALMTKDEQAVARYLPFRPHHKGLYFVEALGLLVSQLSEVERASLLRRYGKKLTAAESGKARLSKDQIEQLETILLDRTREMAEFFNEDYDNIQKRIQSGTTVERCLVVLDNEERELISAKILKQVIKEKPEDAQAAPAQKKGGFFARLFGRN